MFGAAGGVVFRVEVEDESAAFEVGEFYGGCGGVIAADGVGGEGWGFGSGFGVGAHGVVVGMDLVCGRGFISMIREFSRGEVEGWDLFL